MVGDAVLCNSDFSSLLSLGDALSNILGQPHLSYGWWLSVFRWTGGGCEAQTARGTFVYL